MRIWATGLAVESEADAERVVWVATWTCPDHYCGCPPVGLEVGAHLLGVFATEGQAREALESAAAEGRSTVDGRRVGVAAAEGYVTAVLPGCAFIPGVSPGA